MSRRRADVDPASSPRISRDVDLFHDTAEALEVSWRADRQLLEQGGFSVTPLRERPGLVEAVVERGGEEVRLEWARDSAFRFFPLGRHEELGLTLHPFDHKAGRRRPPRRFAGRTALLVLTGSRWGGPLGMPPT